MMLDEKGTIVMYTKHFCRDFEKVAVDRFRQNYVTAIVLVKLFDQVIPETWHKALLGRNCNNIM